MTIVQGRRHTGQQSGKFSFFKKVKVKGGKVIIMLTTVSRILITAGLDIQVTKNVDSGFLHCRHLDIQTSSDHLTGQQSCCPSPPTVNNSQKNFLLLKR
jgi:hypothetical protein